MKRNDRSHRWFIPPRPIPPEPPTPVPPDPEAPPEPEFEPIPPGPAEHGARIAGKRSG